MLTERHDVKNRRELMEFRKANLKNYGVTTNPSADLHKQLAEMKDKLAKLEQRK